MNELFGIPMSALAVALPAAFVAVLLLVAFLICPNPSMYAGSIAAR